MRLDDLHTPDALNSIYAMGHSANHLRRGFTLVELLVVIAITSVLIAWLFSALRQAGEQARLVVCLSNEKQIAAIVNIYAIEHEGYFPVPPLGKYFSQGYDMALLYMCAMIGGDDTGVWAEMFEMPAWERPLARYLEPTSAVWRCPADTYPIPWLYGYPAWDAAMSSYIFNAHPPPNRGFYGKTLSDIAEPGSFLVLGGFFAGWHNTANASSTCQAFADGHAEPNRIIASDPFQRQRYSLAGSRLH